MEGDGLDSQLIVISTSSGELTKVALQPQQCVRPELVQSSADWAAETIHFAPGGQSVAVAGQCSSGRIATTQVINLKSLRVIFGQSIENRIGHDHLSFSADGRALLHLSVRDNDQTFGLTHPATWEWVDLNSGRKQFLPQSHCADAKGAWFVDNNHTIVGNSAGLSRDPPAPGNSPNTCKSVQLWDAVITGIIGVFPGEEVIALPEDRQTFLTKKGNARTRAICVRDAATGKLIAEWPIEELNHGGELFLHAAADRPASIVSSQSLNNDRDDPRYIELKRRRSWWSMMWLFRGQVNVVDAARGSVLRAVPGWGRSQLTADGRLIITQTDEVGWIPRKYWFPWRWTMSAYLVDSAMPWPTAIKWGFLLAIPSGWLAGRIFGSAKKQVYNQSDATKT